LRLSERWILEGQTALLEFESDMESFLTAFDDVPDPRASNTRHDLCGATSCAEMSAFDRSK